MKSLLALWGWLVVTAFGLAVSASAQVQMAKDFYPDHDGRYSFVQYVFEADDDVFFTSVRNYDTSMWELWRSDGTDAGTVRVASFDDMRSRPEYGNYAYLDGYFFFEARAPGDETAFAYVTDGTAAGTRALLDTHTSTGSQRPMHTVGGYVYLQHRVPTDSGMRPIQLFRTDGVSVTQITHASNGMALSGNDVVEVGGAVYFMLNDGYLYSYDGSTLRTLWSEYGYTASNTRYRLSAGALAAVGDFVVFYGSYWDGAKEVTGVYAFDTNSGAVAALSTVLPGTVPLLANTAHVQLFQEHDGWLYFMLPDPSFDMRGDAASLAKKNWLWKTDGTRSGTHQLYEFAEPEGTSYNPLAPVRMEGSTSSHLFLVFKPYSLDEALYSFDYATETVTPLHTFSWGGPVDGQHNSSTTHLFGDVTPDTESDPVVHATTGTAGSSEAYPATVDDTSYRLNLEAGMAVLHDTLFYFAAFTEETGSDVFVFNARGTSTGSEDPEPVEPSVPDTLFSEDFETFQDFPTWYVDGDNDEYDWVVGTLAEDPFAHIDARSPTSAYVPPTSSGGYGILFTEELHLADYDTLGARFHVWYSAAGTQTSRLALYARIDGSYEEVWRASDDGQGTTWREVTVDLTDYAGSQRPVALTLEYFSRQSVGAVAVDNFIVGSNLGARATAIDAPTRDVVPDAVTLYPNYPNPFDTATHLQFSLPAPAEVRIELFDVMGRRVQVVAARPFGSGQHRVEVDAAGLAPGVYVYTVSAGAATQTGKMLLVR